MTTLCTYLADDAIRLILHPSDMGVLQPTATSCNHQSTHLGDNAFRVELHPLDVRVLLVAHTHDGPVLCPRCHLQVFRALLLVYHQAVVAARLEGAGSAAGVGGGAGVKGGMQGVRWKRQASGIAGRGR